MTITERREVCLVGNKPCRLVGTAIRRKRVSFSLRELMEGECWWFSWSSCLARVKNYRKMYPFERRRKKESPGTLREVLLRKSKRSRIPCKYSLDVSFQQIIIAGTLSLAHNTTRSLWVSLV